MKHRELNYHTRNNPGFNPPAAVQSKAGSGYPHKQPFNESLRKEKKRK